MTAWHALVLISALALQSMATHAQPAAPTAPQRQPPSESDPSMNQQLHAHLHLLDTGAVIPLSLNDSAASQQFVAMLPLELVLTDYAHTEKVADLPDKLDTAGSPAGFTPQAGDVAYYAPWGNLAVFYRDFSYSPGLVKLGEWHGPPASLGGSGERRVRIERVGK